MHHLSFIATVGFFGTNNSDGCSLCLNENFDCLDYHPGKKNIRWDPRCVPGGILPFSGGIPTGIMEHPAWDPTN